MIPEMGFVDSLWDCGCHYREWLGAITNAPPQVLLRVLQALVTYVQLAAIGWRLPSLSDKECPVLYFLVAICPISLHITHPFLRMSSRPDAHLRRTQPTAAVSSDHSKVQFIWDLPVSVVCVHVSRRPPDTIFAGGSDPRPSLPRGSGCSSNAPSESTPKRLLQTARYFFAVHFLVFAQRHLHRWLCDALVLGAGESDA